MLLSKVLDYLDVSYDNIEILRLERLDSLSNITYKLSVDTNKYIIKIIEKRNCLSTIKSYVNKENTIMKSLYNIDEYTKIIDNNLVITKFIDGVTLSSLRDREEYSEKVLNLVDNLHSMDKHIINLNKFSFNEYSELYRDYSYDMIDFSTHDVYYDMYDELSKSKNKVISHCDLNDNNILINDNGESYLIDWDYVGLAPKELDISTLMMYNTYKKNKLQIDSYIDNNNLDRELIKVALRCQIYLWIEWSYYYAYKILTNRVKDQNYIIKNYINYLLDLERYYVEVL